MASRALSMGTASQRMGQDLFGDLRVRYGIKMGLAGLLALFCTQVLRLPHDNWAILTVVTSMSAQFVGSIAFKAIMQAVGTIVGALVGIRLVGASQVPFAYYLLGFTTLTIVTNSVTDPAQAWQIGLERTEEILVGIMS